VGVFGKFTQQSSQRTDSGDQPELAQKLEEDGMSKRTYIGAAMVGLAVVLTASALVASNMGFKLNYTLNQTQAGVSKTGTNLIALPDNRQSGMNTAKNLIDDIGLASVLQVQRFVESTDLFAGYTGRTPQSAANDFALTAGDGYVVKMKTLVNYIIVGSDDPALSYQLNQTQVGVSKTGTNLYQYNYHQTAATAKGLLDDIGLASVLQIQRFVRSTDLYGGYTGRTPQSAANDFALVPGDAYVIKMKTLTAYTPSHY
jgi:hypothetical protein